MLFAVLRSPFVYVLRFRAIRRRASMFGLYPGRTCQSLLDGRFMFANSTFQGLFTALLGRIWPEKTVKAACSSQAFEAGRAVDRQPD